MDWTLVILLSIGGLDLAVMFWIALIRPLVSESEANSYLDRWAD